MGLQIWHESLLLCQPGLGPREMVKLRRWLPVLRRPPDTFFLRFLKNNFYVFTFKIHVPCNYLLQLVCESFKCYQRHDSKLRGTEKSEGDFVSKLERNWGFPLWHSGNQWDLYPWGCRFAPWPHSVGQGSIWHCYVLWCGSQMPLGSHIAVAAV